ncbi:DUF5819 family protein [Streptomyces sp. FXJ1.172]|uniref:DUF5819 family protein n=1 Tax=Streptomyces sp. FXJ1.172 TaxID=710705 RepID=UPI00133128D2|nr:DUF5819 family protein [Streptomyces sp. FXJ1.172]WEO97452.1 DUF5819 family protein [Streptomyces sp. FXJ1.172]
MEQFTKTTGDSTSPRSSDIRVGSPRASEAAGPAAGCVEPAVLPDAGATGDVATTGGIGRDTVTHVRSTRSLAVLTATAAVLLGAVLWHLCMVFLTLAPANSVTNRYQKAINGYIYPEFGQNWQMFAPNPLAQNVSVGARVQTLGRDGTRHTWSWENLSFPHLQAMKHNPVPSHLDQNVLRRSWDFYTESHDLKDKPTNGMRSELSAEYLTRIALQHFGHQWNGERIVRIQLASRTNAVAPPKWTGQKTPDTTAYRILPWWPVEEKFYEEL